MAGTRKWVVTTSDDRPLADIAKDLTDAGFNVGQTLAEIGIITGSSDESVVGRARTVKGVTDIAPETTIDIGPPDSPETW
jgi:hypothetical protein